jgi:heat shock protein HslJ
MSTRLSNLSLLLPTAILLVACNRQPRPAEDAANAPTTGAVPSSDSGPGPDAAPGATDSTLSPHVLEVTWQWTRMTTPLEQFDVAPPANYTIYFGSDGRVALKADCNRGTGRYSVSPDRRLTFGSIALTRMMCPEGSLSDRFVKEVGRAKSYFMKDGELFLELPVDSGTLRFQRKP